ncbi:MAG: glycosyltransferase family 9 protein [Rudaea sp.]
MTAPVTTPMLIRFGRMGDMVLQAPLLRLLHRRYGQPCILLSAGAWSTQLYTDNPDVGALWQLRTRHTPFVLSPRRWLLVRDLRRHDGPIYISDDVARQVEKIRSLLTRAGVARERCLFLTDCSEISSVHWVDRLLDFGRLTPAAFGAADYPWQEDDLQRAPCLPIGAQDRVDRDAWLRQCRIDGRPLVLLQPGNKRTSRRKASRQADSKAWPNERWAALLCAMRARLPDAQLLLCGSAHETSLLQEIRQRSGLRQVALATRDLPLRRLLALAEIAHSMVAVDTGPAHVAAAGGCPLVVLYGPQSPERWDRRSPLGRPVINLGGAQPGGRVDAIDLDSVVRAWSSIARG